MTAAGKSSGGMRALVRREGLLELTIVEDPVPAEGQVLARSLACGICGSDLHALHHLEHMVEMGRRSGAVQTLDPTCPLVMGHEFCGEILEYGPGCNRTLKVGTPVVSVPYAYGANGPELIGFSTRFNGAFAERLLLTEAHLVAVPNGLPPKLAALTEPLAVGTHAVALAGMTSNDVAMVVGCGPIGLAVISALKRNGHGPIIATDFSPQRRALAERLGADFVSDPLDFSPESQWQAVDVPATLAQVSMARTTARTRNAVIFECVGIPGILQKVIEAAPPGSHVVVLGACLEDDMISPIIATNKQLRMTFAFAYTAEEFSDTLHALADGLIDGELFVSNTVGMSHAPAAFTRLATRCDEVKVIVEPWR